MAREFEFSIVAEFEDKASRGVKKLSRSLGSLDKMARGRRGGILGGLFGGFAGRGLVSGPQSGIGRVVAGIGRLTAKAVAMPGKIVGAFASALPKIGGIASGAINSVVNVLQGLITTAANVAGHIVNKLTAAFRKVASIAGRVFGKVTKWGTIAFAGITAFSVRQAGKVQNAWNKVRTILQLGPQEAKKMMGNLRNEAIRTGKSLTETVQGYYQILSAGVREPQRALNLLRVSLEASIGGWTEMPTVVKTLTRTMEAFDRGAEETRITMDQLMQTVHTGQIEMPELAQYFASLGKVAAQSNISLEETLGTLGVIARSDEPAKVVTQLRAAFQKIVNPTGQARKELQKLREQGMGVGPEAIEEIGLIEWAERMRRVREEMPETFTKMFPQRAFLGITSLLESSEDIEEAINNIGDAAGTTRSDFETMMDSVIKFARQAWVVVKDLATSFGKPLARWLVSIRDRIGESGVSMDWFREKAKTAGEAVKDTFKGAFETVRQFAEGREFSWEGFKTAAKDLADIIAEQVKAGASRGWKLVKNDVWPKIKTGFTNLMNDLWAILGEKISDLPTFIGNTLQKVAASQMKQAVESSAQQRGWYKPYTKFFDRLTRWEEEGGPISAAIGFPSDLWKQVSGRMGPQNAAQFRMAQMMQRMGAGLTRAGSAMGQTSRNAQRRRLLRGAQGAGRGIMEGVMGARGGGIEPQEWAQLIPQLQKAAQKWGQTRTQQRGIFEELKNLLEEINRDNEIQREELDELKRTVRRLSTARQ